MPYTITITDDSPQALSFIKFARTLDFTKVTKNKDTKKKSVTSEVLEEDEYGIPIKYRDEIMAISKKVNKAVAKRWDAELSKRIKKEAI